MIQSASTRKKTEVSGWAHADRRLDKKKAASERQTWTQGQWQKEHQGVARQKSLLGLGYEGQNLKKN